MVKHCFLKGATVNSESVFVLKKNYETVLEFIGKITLSPAYRPFMMVNILTLLL